MTNRISLFLLLFSALMLSCKKEEPAPPAKEQPAPDPLAFMNDWEKEAFIAVNDHRKSIGKPAFVPNQIVTEVCRHHATMMAKGQAPFNHDGVGERIAEIEMEIGSTSTWGENIQYNQHASAPGKDALKWWLTSPPHRSNIEGDYNIAGMGAFQHGGRTYFCQIFIRK